MKPRSLQSWLRIKPLAVTEGNAHAANVLKEAIEAIKDLSTIVGLVSLDLQGPALTKPARRYVRRQLKIGLEKAAHLYPWAAKVYAEHSLAEARKLNPKPEPKQETERETMIRRLQDDLAPGDELVVFDLHGVTATLPPGCDCAAYLPGNDPSQHALTCSMYRA